MQINIHEAKTHFSKLLARVINGEEIIISKAGKPVAILVPLSDKGPRKPGSAKGKLVIHENFQEPLPAEILESFES